MATKKATGDMVHKLPADFRSAIESDAAAGSSNSGSIAMELIHGFAADFQYALDRRSGLGICQILVEGEA
jgi:hypothetical protein